MAIQALEGYIRVILKLPIVILRNIWNKQYMLTVYGQSAPTGESDQDQLCSAYDQPG